MKSAYDETFLEAALGRSLRKCTSEALETRRPDEEHPLRLVARSEPELQTKGPMEWRLINAGDGLCRAYEYSRHTNVRVSRVSREYLLRESFLFIFTE